MSSTANGKARPQSPSLGIYRPQLTSALSILHRVTGVGLSLGAVVFVWWLVSLAGGADSYATFTGYAQSAVGEIFLFGFSVAFFYHLCNGIRHLLWDAGFFLELKDVYMTGRIVLLTTALLVLLVWLKVYGVSI